VAAVKASGHGTAAAHAFVTECPKSASDGPNAVHALNMLCKWVELDLMSSRSALPAGSIGLEQHIA